MSKKTKRAVNLMLQLLAPHRPREELLPDARLLCDSASVVKSSHPSPLTISLNICPRCS